MLVTSDMYTLINYVGFINYLFYGVTVAGQIVLRWKKPDIPRPIKVQNLPMGSPPPPLLVLVAAQIFQSFSQLLTTDHLYGGSRLFGKQGPYRNRAAIYFHSLLGIGPEQIAAGAIS